MVTILTKDNVRFTCTTRGANAPKTGPVFVGEKVTVTCVFGGDYALTTIKAVAKSNPVKSLTVSGTVVALDGNELLIERLEGFAGGGVGYTFTILPADLQTVSAIAGEYGTPVTVTARAAGRQWIVVTVTRG
jgi:hypothetical protein